MHPHHPPSYWHCFWRGFPAPPPSQSLSIWSVTKYFVGTNHSNIPSVAWLAHLPPPLLVLRLAGLPPIRPHHHLCPPPPFKCGERPQLQLPWAGSSLQKKSEILWMFYVCSTLKALFVLLFFLPYIQIHVHHFSNQTLKSPIFQALESALICAGSQRESDLSFLYSF